MPAQQITVYDIAEKLGVSHATVSMALRNHPGISKKRRVQVQKIAEEMGYTPDPHLAALAAYRRANTPADIRSSIAWISHWEQPERLRKLREFDLYWRGRRKRPSALATTWRKFVGRRIIRPDGSSRFC